ncbi:MAG: amino acid adenylation domain-containing protein, partial [Pedosphaera sp.]|nr:amino acid adenylation domain-containing protein [Pedosphaera sp.]
GRDTALAPTTAMAMSNPPRALESGVASDLPPQSKNTASTRSPSPAFNRTQNVPLPKRRIDRRAMAGNDAADRANKNFSVASVNISESDGIRLDEQLRPGNPFVPFAREELEQSLAARFEKTVARFPERLAVKSGATAWTYRELNRRANRIAHAILERLGKRSEPVCLMMEQGAPLLAAILGVLKAGKFYVPLDATHPVARLRQMVASAEARLVVTDTANLRLASELATNGALNVDDLIAADLAADENPGLDIAPDALAYIFFTSGTTGQPKGVMDNQRNVLHNVLRYTNQLHLAAEDRLTLVQSASFSGAVSNVFGALLNGAAVFPFDLRREGFARLAELLREEQITIYHSVPMIFRNVVAVGGTFPSVRVVRLEGDAAAPADAELFREHFAADCLLVNGLGATETGIVRQFFLGQRTPLTGATLPIGHPVPDVEIELLDETGASVAVGEVGEIAVRSRFLAVGYWRDPELTRQKFTADPARPGERVYRTGDLGRFRPDGCLEYLGRRDHQFKIRGQRVETAEVEHALREVAGAKEAAIATLSGAEGEPMLVAYLAPRATPPRDEEQLRGELRRRLPEFMVPARFVELDALPLNENGKLDRRALPSTPEKVAVRREPPAPPRDECERRLVELWETVLAIKPIGVRDLFFELGGDSLRAAQLAAAIARAFECEFTPPALVLAQTVEGCAKRLRGKMTAGAISPRIVLRTGDSRAPFFLIDAPNGVGGAFAELARQLPPGPPVVALASCGIPNMPEVGLSIGQMAEACRSEIRAAQRTGPYYLGGNCLGATVAFETAHALVAEGESVALLVLFGISPREFPSLVGAGTWRKFRHGELRQRLGWHWNQMRGHGLAGARQHLGAWWQQRRETASWLRAREASAAPGASLPPALKSIFREAQLAVQRYRPTTFAGEVTLFLGEASTRNYTDNPAKTWRGLSQQSVVVHEFPGSHGELFGGENARRMAELLAPKLPPRPGG